MQTYEMMTIPHTISLNVAYPSTNLLCESIWNRFCINIVALPLGIKQKNDEDP